METKTALVSGGTDGVGKSIVEALVEHHYDVYFIGSNKAKGLKLESELKRKANSKVSFVLLDLSDLKAVKQFAVSLSETLPRLDLLLLSAGVALPKRLETPEGIEKTFAIGYLSAYILTKELIPLLEKGDKSRVLTVSGGGPIVLKERLDFDDFNNAKTYNAIKAAARTVHAKTVLTEILADKLESKKITVNSFHPGIVKSGLARELPRPLSWGFNSVSMFMPRVSKTGIYACLSDSLDGVSGQFIINKKQIPLKFNQAYKEKLIEKTENILSKVLVEEAAVSA